jgi:ATP/ADP translocase
MATANPDDVKNVVEGVVSVLALFGWLPGAIVAPLVLLGGGIAGLFTKGKKDNESI